jgi:hypothetical protein
MLSQGLRLQQEQVRGISRVIWEEYARPFAKSTRRTAHPFIPNMLQMNHIRNTRMAGTCNLGLLPPYRKSNTAIVRLD